MSLREQKRFNFSAVVIFVILKKPDMDSSPYTGWLALHWIMYLFEQSLVIAILFCASWNFVSRRWKVVSELLFYSCVDCHPFTLAESPVSRKISLCVALFTSCEAASINAVLNKWFSLSHIHSSEKDIHIKWAKSKAKKIDARRLWYTKGALMPMGNISWPIACFQM